jgi:hypothetical protein
LITEPGGYGELHRPDSFYHRGQEVAWKKVSGLRFWRQVSIPGPRPET